MSSLIKIDEEIVSSAVASVTLTGIDSTYVVYMVKFNNAGVETDIKQIKIRFTVGGTADSTANYDYAHKNMRVENTFQNVSATNQNQFGNYVGLGTGTSETEQGIIYIYNANNSGEYTFATYELVSTDFQPYSAGNMGGVVNTVAQAVDGIEFSAETGNLSDGSKFTLYGLKK